MLFNSLDFAIFLPIFFILYWIILKNNTNKQNILIVLGSYLFYGWWDWRFLSLIIISSLLDFFVGLKLHRTENQRIRKVLLITSLGVNLGMLGFFKYFNFFVASLTQGLSALGLQINPWTLNIILPVGISFYTFQTLSYTIDIYKKKLVPTDNMAAFLAFVSFFPQLVAGPIERASNLLPQFLKPREFDQERAVDGLRQILWGLFKKVVVADTCASNVDVIFSNSANLSGSTLLLGGVFFAFQIYGDFSGYSDIAIGTARLLGFQLMRNFALPYFSRDIAEFWRRWHISLSSWFRDYLYIPLGGSRGSRTRRIFNILTVFTVSGLWHGPNWTFVFWGFLNGLYYIPLMLFGKQKTHTDQVAQTSRLPSLREFAQVGLTFGLTVIAWIFFRSTSLTQAFTYLGGLASPSLLSMPTVGKGDFFWIVVLVAIDWIQRKKAHGFEIQGLPTILRWVIYLGASITILAFFKNDSSFIYFQF